MKRKWMALAVAVCVVSVRAAETNVVFPIDLLAVLRLAGAQNLDIQIARARLAEARANYGGAVSQFFPTFTPGITYRRHDDNIQDVAGNVIEVHKQSYAPGATIGAQVDFGDAIYKQLAAKQLFRAADHAMEAQRQESTAAAAQSYFDLLVAQAGIGVVTEAVNISSNYEAQVEQAVGAGLHSGANNCACACKWSVINSRCAVRWRTDGRPRPNSRNLCILIPRSICCRAMRISFRSRCSKPISLHSCSSRSLHGRSSSRARRLSPRLVR